MRFFALFLIGTILTASALSVTARQKLLGQLTIESKSAASVIKINDESAVSGSSVLPATEIVTPLESSAKISFGKVGQIELAPNTKINLNFNETTISSFLTSGQLTLAAAPNTGITIQTVDGIITKPNMSENSVIVVDFIDGKTRVRTDPGTAAFNGHTIAEGQTFSEGMADSASTNESVPADSFYSDVFASFLRATHFGNLVLDTHNRTGTIEPQISSFNRPEHVISHHK